MNIKNINKFVVVSLAIVVLLGCSSLPNPEVAEVIEARALLDQWSGQGALLIKAKGLIDVVLEENPQNAQALKELGRFYIMDGYKYGKRHEPGTFEKAEKVLLSAIEIDPNYDGSYVLLGHVYERMNLLGKAQEALSKADSLHSNDPWLHLNWATLLQRLERDDEAKERYLKVIDTGTDSVKALSAAYHFLIEERQEEGDQEGVDSYYQKVFEMKPSDAWSRGNYSMWLRQDVGDFDKAIQYAREALSIMNYGVGRRELGLALYAKWDQLTALGVSASEASAYFEEAQSYYPNLEDAFAYLGGEVTTFAAAKRLALDFDVPVNGGDHSQYTALSRAASDGETEIAIKLLEMGVDPYKETRKGYMALTIAIFYGHTETALALLAHGVSPDANGSKYDALTIANWKKDIEVIEVIQKLGTK